MKQLTLLKIKIFNNIATEMNRTKPKRISLIEPEFHPELKSKPNLMYLVNNTFKHIFTIFVMVSGTSLYYYQD